MYKLQPLFSFLHMDNDVTFEQLIQSELKWKMETTLGEKGMWPLLSISSSQLQTCKGTKSNRKIVLNYHIFHWQNVRDYERFKAGRSQTLCLFSSFFILPSPTCAGTCSRKDSSNPSLINTSPNLLVILLIVHKPAI